MNNSNTYYHWNKERLQEQWKEYYKTIEKDWKNKHRINTENFLINEKDIKDIETYR